MTPPRHTEWMVLRQARLSFGEPRRLVFRESALVSDPGRVILAPAPGPAGTDVLFEAPDLAVLFHPDTPEHVLGGVVNRLRSLGHEVVVEQAPAPGRT